jgi:hypothetical protein
MRDRLSIDALEHLGQQFHDLDELESAGEDSASIKRSRVRGRRVSRVGFLVAALLAVSTSLAVAAVNGIFDRQPDGLVRESKPRTVARGTDPLFGTWKAVTYMSDRGLCLDVTVEHNIADEALMSGSCGGDHSISRDGGAPGRADKTFFYGLAPFDAATVAVRPKGGQEVAVAVHPIDREMGSFYLVSIDRLVESGEATAFGPSGTQLGSPVYTP